MRLEDLEEFDLGSAGDGLFNEFIGTSAVDVQRSANESRSRHGPGSFLNAIGRSSSNFT
jgi:hypothetical protein